MHHGPNCGGASPDRSYYDALTEATSNLVRVRELEAEAAEHEERRRVMANQIMMTGFQRGDREEALQRQIAAAPPRPALPQSNIGTEQNLLGTSSLSPDRRPAYRRRTPRSPR